MMISSIGQNTVYKNDDLLSIEINYNALENSLNNKGVNENYVKEFFKKLKPHLLLNLKFIANAPNGF